MMIAPTERTELAQLALRTALEHEDVLEGVAGPGGTLITQLELSRLYGVGVTAATGGGYDVVLRLKTRLVPLPALAEELRKRIISARDNRAGRPRSVEIQIADVEGP